MKIRPLPRPCRVMLLLCAGGLWQGFPVTAREAAAEEENPPRNIEALVLSDKRPPRLYYRDMEGEYKPFRIGFQRSGGINRVPPSDSLALFRKIEPAAPNEEGPVSSTGPVPGEEPPPPTYQPVFELKPPPGDDPLLLVFFLDRNLKLRHRFLDAGADAFGAMEIQLVNLSDTLPVIAMLDDKRFDMQPGTVITTAAKVHAEKRFSFQYGSLQPSGTTYTSPETRLQIPFENMRLRIFFASVQRVVETPQGQRTEMVLRDARVFERVEP